MTRLRRMKIFKDANFEGLQGLLFLKFFSSLNIFIIFVFSIIQQKLKKKMNTRKIKNWLRTSMFIGIGFIIVSLLYVSI